MTYLDGSYNELNFITPEELSCEVSLYQSTQPVSWTLHSIAMHRMHMELSASWTLTFACYM